ncbi:hypothetical protein KIN20_026976 [Parelaphostrongylus tenuis]|uniref:Uncharacterized protein n=1 Tax=Parelaphostrongylus tenuis TaxID=148309 RepID=A0AAD5WDL3_PARTN|nr:hypothetical protein KIN20_026976 [Parelaphostrongylus tenuis]
MRQVDWNAVLSVESVRPEQPGRSGDRAGPVPLLSGGLLCIAAKGTERVLPLVSTTRFGLLIDKKNYDELEFLDSYRMT